MEDAAALEAQYAEDPTTGDKLATLKAKATRACFDAGGLSAERMVYTETRKALPPDALAAFKAARTLTLTLTRTLTKATRACFD